MVSGVQNSGAAGLAIFAGGLVQAGQMGAGLEGPLSGILALCLAPGLGSPEQWGGSRRPPTWSPSIGASGCVPKENQVVVVLVHCSLEVAEPLSCSRGSYSPPFRGSSAKGSAVMC